MHVFHLNLLQAAGGAVVEKYKGLVAAADASAAGSRAEEDLQKFSRNGSAILSRPPRRLKRKRPQVVRCVKHGT